MIYKKIHLIKIVIMGFIFYACGTEPVNVCDYKNADISYECIQGIFDLSCVGCHNASQGQQPFLEQGMSYTNIKNQPSLTSEYNYVEVGNANDSHIFNAVSNNNLPSFLYMPPSGSPYPELNQDQIDYIELWINDGANQN